jgi:hypothetical protein
MTFGNLRGNARTIESPSIINKEPLMTATEKNGKGNTEHQGLIEGNVWQPAIFRNAPIWGLGAVFGTLACCVGTILIVIVSNGDKVESWKVQPSVLLAILIAGANATMTFALAGGAVNAWWYKAYKGATVTEIQWQWSLGDSLWDAMCAGRHVSLVALATIVGTWAVFGTDPLMQRSTGVISKNITEPVSVIASIAPLIPYGYTGISTTRGGTAFAPTPPAMDAARDFFNKVPINLGFYGCKDNCKYFHYMVSALEFQ